MQLEWILGLEIEELVSFAELFLVQSILYHQGLVVEGEV
jgi:hypothetical protein